MHTLTPTTSYTCTHTHTHTHTCTYTCTITYNALIRNALPAYRMTLRRDGACGLGWPPLPFSWKPFLERRDSCQGKHTRVYMHYVHKHTDERATYAQWQVLTRTHRPQYRSARRWRKTQAAGCEVTDQCSAWSYRHCGCTCTCSNGIVLSDAETPRDFCIGCLSASISLNICLSSKQRVGHGQFTRQLTVATK